MRNDWHFGLALCLGSALIAQPAFAAKEPITLKPSTKWHVTYDDDYCRLIRAFGDEDQEAILSLSRYGPGDAFMMTIGLKAIKFRSRGRDLFYRFGPSEPEQQAKYFRGNIGKEKLPAIIFREFMRVTPYSPKEQKAIDEQNFAVTKNIKISDERYAAIDQLLIGKSKGKPAFILQLGSLKNPMKAFDACIDNLMTQWGIDADRHKTLSKPVELAIDADRLPRAIKYPTNMLRKGKQAIVQFRLGVDETGKATACHIQRSTRPKEFDDAVCKGLIRRTRFEPALDAQGQPLASYWRSTVIFSGR